ncbi:AAA family ATPase [Janthinobacterium sp. GW458P]|nr:AAA family ATPase [Janthinobacterium sp. GW458P]
MVPKSNVNKYSSSMSRCVVITGCSGAGKSTLLSELQRRGHTVIKEPGRRIVQEEMRTGGRALPWLDMSAFLHRVVEMALIDYAAAQCAEGRWVFFDRSIIDAAAALQALEGSLLLAQLGESHRYHPCVFLAPPWPDIYVKDAERRHNIDAALEEFDRLERAYPSLGYEVALLPRICIRERADFVLQALAAW